MRYIGLDLGEKTLGISISNGIIATNYCTLRHNKDYDYLISEVAKIVDEKKIDKIILGFPKNMNNTIGDRCETTLEFKKLLEENFDIIVVLQDERLSTVEATNYMLEADVSRKKRKKKIDSLAANIILQTYLDKEKGGRL
jgi:putative Holliday junction resolvase